VDLNEDGNLDILTTSNQQNSFATDVRKRARRFFARTGCDFPAVMDAMPFALVILTATGISMS